MRPPQSLNLIEGYAAFELRAGWLFDGIASDSLRALNSIRSMAIYPKGVMLCVEGRFPHWVYVLHSGRAKLSVCSREGRVLITQITEPGDALGIGAAITGKPYEATAETIEPCQISLVKREDFLHFLREHGDACLRVTEHLSQKCYAVHEHLRLLGLSDSASAKLARFLSECCARYGRETEQGITLNLTLTHEELAQLIGVSRETVTRLLCKFRNEQIIQTKGATLLVRDKGALEGKATA